ncbi:hypothetical protein KY338_05470 [Candidatus Woesearchaeota archaeon]|nr:hypothetical protein [Candidatus Woesearchaeota archaeon]MBW3006352.1 hypothetical protein [Candidatus Woesearchaeota archaeon]
MTIKTARSVAADIKEFLLKRENAKAKVLNSLTHHDFLDVEVLTGGIPEDKAKLISDTVDNMLEPINKQVKKITDEQNYIEEKKPLLKQIVRLLKAELTQIVKVKEAMVDKNPDKISESLKDLHTIVQECKEKIEEI